jgi:hypothetical protein
MSESQAGLHVILIGVSAYDPLPSPQPGGLQRPFAATSLDGPARTVAALFDWLTSPKTQLITPIREIREVTLLASPTAEERDQIRTLANCKAATTENVVAALKDWRKAASLNRNHTTFFYFAGHGIQRSATDSVMLLQDFNLGDTLLEKSISLGNIYGGMGSTRGLPNLARTQWYFADCCRSAVASLRDYELAATAHVFNVEADLADDRQAPIFQAANSGNETYTLAGQCTAFGSDLLRCLGGVGANRGRVQGQACWLVNANSLAEGMGYLTEEYNGLMLRRVEKWNLENPTMPISKTFRRTPVTTLVSNPTLCQLADAPAVPCTFQPELSGRSGLIEVELGPTGTRPLPKHNPPFATLDQLILPAGYYELGATLLDAPPPGTKRAVGPQPVWVSPPVCIMDIPA